MTSWPAVPAEWQNDALLHDIGVVQKVVGLARAARGQSGVRTRQPLSRLLIRAPDDTSLRALESHQDQVLEELNVKSIEFIARDAGLVNYRIKPNLPVLGKQYGKKLPLIRAALAEVDGAEVAGAVARGEAYDLDVGGETLALQPGDVLVETSSAAGYACGEDGGYLTALDTTLSQELMREGLARELVRAVQEARKQAGLEVSDRIVLGVSGSPAVEAALLEYRDYLMTETLASTWQVEQPAPGYEESKNLDGDEWTIRLSKA
jgi:isoleucyl-tRNA synthetase